MDYKGQVCPVCKKTFEKNDEIVVCPICGTPHHRDCYDSIGTCVNQNRHRENYDYQRELDVNSVDADGLVCPACGGHNPADSRFCNSCGKPVNFDGQQQSAPYVNNGGDNGNSKNHTPNGMPQGGFGGVFVMDPLGGVAPDYDIGNGVTAGEAAKLVKTNTPFYIPQFKRMKESNRSRFSFVGFLFAGGWMLYRKMYKLGTFFTVLWGLILVAQTYISVFYANFLNNAIEAYYDLLSNYSSFIVSGTDVFSELFSKMSTEQIIIFVTYFALSFLTIVMRIICGIFGNRWYYKHVVKTASKVKLNTSTPQETDAKLSAMGGVNVPLAVSLVVSYYILMYLPLLL